MDFRVEVVLAHNSLTLGTLQVLRCFFFQDPKELHHSVILIHISSSLCQSIVYCVSLGFMCYFLISYISEWPDLASSAEHFFQDPKELELHENRHRDLDYLNENVSDIIFPLNLLSNLFPFLTSH